MRFPRGPFTLKNSMWAVAFLAPIITVVVQEARIRGGRVREEQLRATLAEADARAAWASSIDEWQQVGDSTALKKQRGDGLRRGQGTLPR